MWLLLWLPAQPLLGECRPKQANNHAAMAKYPEFLEGPSSIGPRDSSAISSCFTLMLLVFVYKDDTKKRLCTRWEACKFITEIQPVHLFEYPDEANCGDTS